MFSVGMGRHNSFVGYAACRYLLLFGNHKTNVLPDMHVLLSAAKNSTVSNIRICDPKNIPINQQ